mmetsp:Transcript_7136/g.24973  ORF Transcript_7136/g.24973 Transcript_7136/m.24973 type:complete len:248 (+) Transcript_7136:470-1213(+)
MRTPLGSRGTRTGAWMTAADEVDTWFLWFLPKANTPPRASTQSAWRQPALTETTGLVSSPLGILDKSFLRPWSLAGAGSPHHQRAPSESTATPKYEPIEADTNTSPSCSSVSSSTPVCAAPQQPSSPDSLSVVRAAAWQSSDPPRSAASTAASSSAASSSAPPRRAESAAPQRFCCHGPAAFCSGDAAPSPFKPASHPTNAHCAPAGPRGVRRRGRITVGESVGGSPSVKDAPQTYSLPRDTATPRV